MIITAAGPVNGHIKELYQKVTGSWVLCTGSLGVWPDKNRVNRATKRYGVGDFPELYLEQWTAPTRTLFVRGPQEDHRWLSERQKLRQLELLPNLILLMTGYRTLIDQDIRIVGLGGVYSPKFFNSNHSGKYYTKKNIDQACDGGSVDIFLSNVGPEDPGVRTIVYQTHPKLFIHSTYMKSKAYDLLGIPTIALGKGEVKTIEYNDEKFFW